MNPPPAHSRQGELLFDDAHFTLPPAAPFGVFSSSPIRARFALHAAGDATVCRCDRELVFGSPCAVSLRFEQDRLAQAELFLHLPGDTTDWNSWTQAQEFERKHAAQAWAARVFGVPLVPMPIDVDGASVIPEWGDRTPLHAVHPWGVIQSFYDSKGGSSYMRIKYGPAPGLTQ
ncbi:MAG: hypothetical protein H7210_11385 [Pyrinomonadaceae bacterium]|nr:hypothetical protein [Phycisphaerales bacterium]